MNIHEFQGKSILKKYGVAVPAGIVAATPGEAVSAAKELQKETGTVSFAVKAQIHAGGRGKGGGIKIAGSIDEVKQYAGEIIGMQLITHQTGSEGKKVNRVLIEQNIYYTGDNPIKEYYMSILLNRNTSRNIVMYSPEGGMDIETVAAKTPHLIFKEEIDPAVGLQPFQARKIAFNLGLEGNAFKEMIKFSTALYKAYIESDALLFEINPVIKTSDNKIFAADTKVNLDDNALFRHPEYSEMRDLAEEDPAEVEASRYNLNFIKLDGNIGCMVNGAGLAMATMDMIKLSGGNPANFLDVGGAASAETVEAGFRIILKDPNVKAILINIFGGIVRCDRVAQGIVESYESIKNIKVPVIVRLQGTNAMSAKELIDKSGMKILSAITLEEASELIKNSI
jgi:succinyl-CoA synthetase beta subunit